MPLVNLRMQRAFLALTLLMPFVLANGNSPTAAKEHREIINKALETGKALVV